MPARLKRRSTWIVVFARTLRTGNSDSRIRSPLKYTTPARSGPTGDRPSRTVPLHLAVPVE